MRTFVARVRDGVAGGEEKSGDEIELMTAAAFQLSSGDGEGSTV